jgi:DNA modification methylase
MEISPQYVDVAIRRWQALTGKTATLEATGGAFNG